MDISNVKIESVINSLSDGVYVCDLDRTITYWSKSAQRITGWREEDVVGRQLPPRKTRFSLPLKDLCKLAAYDRSMITKFGWILHKYRLLSMLRCQNKTATLLDIHYKCTCTTVIP